MAKRLCLASVIALCIVSIPLALSPGHDMLPNMTVSPSVSCIHNLEPKASCPLNIEQCLTEAILMIPTLHQLLSEKLKWPYQCPCTKRATPARPGKFAVVSLTSTLRWNPVLHCLLNLMRAEYHPGSVCEFCTVSSSSYPDLRDHSWPRNDTSLVGSEPPVRLQPSEGTKEEKTITTTARYRQLYALNTIKMLVV